MGIDFPITISAFLTVLGVAVFAALVAQWLKSYLPDWRFTQLLVLVIAEIAAIIAQFIAAAWRPSAEQVFTAALIGFFGASLAGYGYEGIANILGMLGKGPRSNAALHEISLRNIERCIGKLPRMD